MSESTENANGPADKRLLERWPWAVGRLHQWPDRELVEHHGRQLLSWALAMGRLTAFVGSGASGAYGRISWSDLVDGVVEHYLEQASNLTDLLAKPETRHNGSARRRSDRDSTLSTLRHIRALLEGLQQTKSDSGNAADQLARYQLASHLSREVAAIKQQDDDFYLEVGRRVQNFAGHATALLERLPGVVKAGGLSTLLKRRPITEVSLRGENWRHFRFEWDRLPARQRQAAWFKLPPSASPATFHRVVAALALLPEPVHVHLVKALGTRQAGAGRVARSDYANPARDPLLYLSQELKINRFLTTNYDHEIERLFLDIGQKAADIHAQRSARREPATETLFAPSRRQWTALTAAPEAIGDVSVATSRGRSSEGWVVYLHGRAADSADSKDSMLVATEQDYRLRYERLDTERSMMDDCVRLAFGASPLLFLGIGFDEIDLLRPLRQFMSDRARTGERVAIALMPADRSEALRALKKIELLQRYGVYVVHFGGDDLWRAHDLRNCVLTAWSALGRLRGKQVRAERRASSRAHHDRRIQEELKQLNVEFDDARKKLSKATRAFKTASRLGSALPQSTSLDKQDCEDLLASARLTLEAFRKRGHMDGRFTGHEATEVAAGVLCRGAVSGLTTSALCRELIKTRGAADLWMEQWRTRPESRRPGGPVAGKQLRCHMKLLETSGWPNRFYAGAASQTFNALNQALMGIGASETTHAARAARKLDQFAARKVIHLRDVHLSLSSLFGLFLVRGQGV